jgi:hypothetical protein
MALLSFRGISTPSLQAQGEQRRLPISTLAGTIPRPICTFDIPQSLECVDKRIDSFGK